MKILYEDQHILVCHKEAGLPVESADVTKKDLESLLRRHLMEEGKTYLGVVHRLDQPVEGILVFALTKAADADLSRQVQSDEMEKVYHAVVLRQEEMKEQGTLRNYLLKDAKTRTAKIVKSAGGGAKEALLSYRLLKENEDGTVLLEIHLKTGRFHQIRAQLAAAGMPIVGDMKYGNAADRTSSRGSGLMLKAVRLSFTHPSTKKRMTFSIEE